jgi:glycopeptide antibiotics resistance protein
MIWNTSGGLLNMAVYFKLGRRSSKIAVMERNQISMVMIVIGTNQRLVCIAGLQSE